MPFDDDIDPIEPKIIVDPVTLKGSRCEFYNDLLGGIKLDILQFILSGNGHFYNLIDAGDLLDKIEERLAQPDIPEADREFLMGLKNSVSPDDNGYIVHGKYK